ncbi:hypothetical protein TNCV_477951 [Trichonephila clavipes]|nr:hypothetical protein TNCV_477951 [Trichonephila clavipes]
MVFDSNERVFDLNEMVSTKVVFVSTMVIFISKRSFSISNHFRLAVRMYFLRCGGLLDDWSVEGVLDLVFMARTSLGSTGPNTSSKHNQSGLIDELLA